MSVATQTPAPQTPAPQTTASRNQVVSGPAEPYVASPPMRSGVSDKEIQRVAILMCEELGIDPFTFVTVASDATNTPCEKLGMNPFPPVVQVHRPSDGSPPYEIAGSRPIQNPVNVPQWVAFRPQAALALAGWRAVHKYVLTET